MAGRFDVFNKLDKTQLVQLVTLLQLRLDRSKAILMSLGFTEKQIHSFLVTRAMPDLDAYRDQMCANHIEVETLVLPSNEWTSDDDQIFSWGLNQLINDVEAGQKPY